jgi:hypothetical protein
MITILAAGALLSIFHALIPSHWLPIIALGKSEGWSGKKVLGVTLVSGTAHVLSTILAGLALAAAGGALTERLHGLTHWIMPAILIVWGIYYIYAHYYHHHFHLHRQRSDWGVVTSLALSMFFSPCLEIEAYFLTAGEYGASFVYVLAAVYGLISIVGMVVWVWLAQHGLHRLNWHRWEHNAGIITGITLVVSGIISGIYH